MKKPKFLFGEEYYLPRCISSGEFLVWVGDKIDKRFKRRGFACKTKLEANELNDFILLKVKEFWRDKQ